METGLRDFISSLPEAKVSFRSKKFQDIFEKCVDEMGQFLFKDYRAEPIA
jgi:hypothetical protein